MDDTRLPFDPRTVLVGLWRRRFQMLGIVLLSALLGVLAGWAFGFPTYEAETALTYRVPPDSKLATVEAGLNTELNQVKVPVNLADVRTRLGIDRELEELAADVAVRVEKNSTLMAIRASADTPEGAARLANTTRDVFLEKWMARQIDGLDRLHDAAATEVRRVEGQQRNLEQVMDNLQQTVAKELEATSGPDNPANLAFRYQQIRERIQEDRAARVAAADMAQRELELARAKALRSKELISPAEFEQVVTAYEKQKALSKDTEQTAAWRKELDRMAKVMENARGGTSPTADLLHATMMRAFDLELSRVGFEDRLDGIVRAQAEARATYERLTGASRSDPEAYARDRADLQVMLSRIHDRFDPSTPSFLTVADAVPPSLPATSRTKLVAASVAILGILIGLLGVLGRELLDPTVRSAPELALRLSLPVLGVVPRRGGGLAAPAKGDVDPGVREAFRVLAQRVRGVVPRKGARLMVASAGPGEGRNLVVAHLAAALGQRDERVLVIDAQVRDDREETELETLGLAGGEPPRGLGDLLGGDKSDLEALVRKTVLPGVHLLPHGRESVVPEALASARMGEILEEASRRYTLVLVEVPGTQSAADAGLAAPWCDAILLVARSRSSRIPALRNAMETLGASGVPIVGAVLNDVPAPYLEAEGLLPAA